MTGKQRRATRRTIWPNGREGLRKTTPATTTKQVRSPKLDKSQKMRRAARQSARAHQPANQGAKQHRPNCNKQRTLVRKHHGSMKPAHATSGAAWPWRAAITRDHTLFFRRVIGGCKCDGARPLVRGRCQTYTGAFRPSARTRLREVLFACVWGAG